MNRWFPTGVAQFGAALAVMALSLVLSDSARAQDESRLKRILDSGVLRVGTTGDWNPMTVRDTASKEYKGFDIDLAKELAKDMGVKVEFVPTDWKTLVNGIVSDKYDLSTSASVSMGRAKVAGYTKSYYQVGTVPLTLKKNLTKFQSWDDINQEGVTVAVTLGTVFEAQAKQFFPDATIKNVEAPARDFQEILSNRAEVSITSNVEAATLIKKYPQLGVIAVDRARNPAPLALLVAQSDQVWLNYVNHWIDLKEANGFFESLETKWLANE